MKDFSKATPRPWWASGESSSNGAYKIEDAEGWHVAWIKEKKDVHLIVTAVNSFEKMKEACEALIELRDFIANHHGDDSDETPILDRALEAIQNLPSLK